MKSQFVVGHSKPGGMSVLEREIQSEGQTDRQKDRQTDRQKDRRMNS